MCRTNEGALTAALIQARVLSECSPADGMSAAAQNKDFGMSRLAALLSGYLSLASKRKGQWPLLLFSDFPRTTLLGATLRHRLDHSRHLLDDLIDLCLAHDQGRRERDGVAGDADHQVLAFEGVHHRVIGAPADR